MSNIGDRLRISTMAFDNTRVLIENYAVEDKKLRRFKDRKERIELANRFTIALNGMIMLMSELDRNRTIELLDEHKILNNIKKSVDRLRIA